MKEDPDNEENENNDKPITQLEDEANLF